MDDRRLDPKCNLEYIKGIKKGDTANSTLMSSLSHRAEGYGYPWKLISRVIIKDYRSLLNHSHCLGYWKLAKSWTQLFIYYSSLSSPVPNPLPSSCTHCNQNGQFSQPQRYFALFHPTSNFYFTLLFLVFIVSKNSTHYAIFLVYKDSLCFHVSPTLPGGWWVAFPFSMQPQLSSSERKSFPQTVLLPFSSSLFRWLLMS